ncbi:MAG TPA: tRNA (adenosine(37)-N6)-threonylcarbamoyltransferase complex dimerization subunit type 1 TsaB [Moorella mulderi]|nr:tRNA (adenosine(37)-N6)-threonylcarbamoyltransferase complex dimerization subunit type 1 TsaB [Moorella mulderi]
MLVLGIDSATSVLSAALMEGENLRGEISVQGDKERASDLLSLIDQLLQKTGTDFSQVEGIAVSLGPGSFTGLRIGLATAKGLAHAGGKPLVGVPTLDALAWNAWGINGIICPVLYARRQEIYSALYRWQEGKLCLLAPYQALHPSSLLVLLDSYREPVYLLGDGVRPFGEWWRQLGSRVYFLPSTHFFPRAGVIAFLGGKRLQMGEVDDLFRLKPIYLRPAPGEGRA